MRPTISRPQPTPASSGRVSPAMRSSPQNAKGSPSSARSSRPSPATTGGCGGPSVAAGPSGCSVTCAMPSQCSGSSPQRPPRPEDVGGPTASLYESAPAQKAPSLMSPSSSPSKLKLARVSTATTLHRHLSIASSSSVLPFSSRRRPSIPLEDFPTSPSDDEWEDFSFEADIAPVSPVRHTIRRKSSVPLSPRSPISPRLSKGASLSRSHASRRSRRTRFTHMSSRNPISPGTSGRNPSIYSSYSFYTPSQLDESPNDQDDLHAPDSSDLNAHLTVPDLNDNEVNELGEIPTGANMFPRGSVSSVSTVRPAPEQQRSQSRLGGLRDKFRWLPGRSDSSSDESVRGRTGSDVSLSSSGDAAWPSYMRAHTTSHASLKQRGEVQPGEGVKPVVFSKPGFRSLRTTKSNASSSSDFQPGHGYKSSTDSSSYAASFSSFEQNLRIGGTAGSYSSCDNDSFFENSPRNKPRQLSPARASSFVIPVDEQPKNTTGPTVPTHVRSRSHNFKYPRPRTVKSFESLRQPTLRDKNDVPHHPFQPSAVPYPLAYSSTMMAADRWNHALLFGDERNPANAGGLLRGSTVTFSQFYGVGSGRKEILKGKELRGGRVLDIGCGEGLWVLAAAKEWKHTCFVGFDLMPVQMDLHEKLQGVKNACDIIDRIQWVNGDCLNAALPFDDNSFDLIRLANMTLALPTDSNADNWRLRALFSEIFRVLKVDGELEVIDENHTVPSASTASPAHPDNAAFDPCLGPQQQQLEQAFHTMLKYHNLSAYPVIPDLLKQHFSTSNEKAHFRLAVAPDPNVVDGIARRDGLSDQTAARVSIDLDLEEEELAEAQPTHGRTRSHSGSAPHGRNRKMLQLLGKEFAESRKSTTPQGLIVLPNKMLPMAPAAVYAHATHSTNVLLAAKEQLFNFVELCAQGRAVADRQEYEELLWQYEASRFDRIGLRDPFQTFNDWDTGLSDANEGLSSTDLRSPKFAACTSPPPEAQRAGSMGPLPAWRYECESDIVAVREIRVCLARKLSVDAPVYNPPAQLRA